jgi:hypothetical protein
MDSRFGQALPKLSAAACGIEFVMDSCPGHSRFAGSIGHELGAAANLVPFETICGFSADACPGTSLGGVIQTGFSKALYTR